MLVSSRAPVSAKEIRLGVAQQDSYFLLRTLLSAWTDICTHMCSYTTQCTFKNRPHVFSTFFLRLCYFVNICVPECKSLPRVCSTAGGQERAQDPRDHVSQLTAAGNQTKALWEQQASLPSTLSPAWVFTHFSRLSEVKYAVMWRASS